MLCDPACRVGCCSSASARHPIPMPRLLREAGKESHGANRTQASKCPDISQARPLQHSSRAPCPPFSSAQPHVRDIVSLFPASLPSSSVHSLRTASRLPCFNSISTDLSNSCNSNIMLVNNRKAVNHAKHAKDAVRQGLIVLLDLTTCYSRGLETSIALAASIVSQSKDNADKKQSCKDGSGDWQQRGRQQAGAPVRCL